MKILFFLLFLLFVNVGFCNETTEIVAKWKTSCTNLVKNMHKLIVELAKTPRDGETALIIENVKNLKQKASKLAKKIMERHQTNLLKPLIAHHSLKISQFCKNLMIGIDELNDNLIRTRLLQKIGSITVRVGQVQRMLNTTLMDFREIWQLVAGFEIDKDSSDAMDKLIEQVSQKIDNMLRLIGQNGGNYYRDKQPFDDAKKELLLVMISTDAKPSQKKRMAQILKIVPTLWATASTDMLQNVVNDLLGPSIHFYGFTFLIEFGRQLHSANVLIYEGILNDSTLNIADKDKIKAPFKHMLEKAVQLFEDWKNNKINQLEVIGIRLKREMNKQWEQNWAAFTEVGVTIKRKQLINNLMQVQNVFANVYDELEMMDLNDSCKMMKAKLDAVKNILKSLKIDSSNDEMQISDAILSFLRTEELEKSIEMESSISSTNDIWNFKSIKSIKMLSN